MRIDKFIWCVRLFKTRSLAGEAVRGGKVLIDELPVKPSREVSAGMTFTLKRHGFVEVFEVLELPKSRVGAKLVEAHIKDITPREELEKQEFLRLARNVTRQKGLGRPTKKDRRDIDDVMDS